MKLSFFNLCQPRLPLCLITSQFEALVVSLSDIYNYVHFTGHPALKRFKKGSLNFHLEFEIGEHFETFYMQYICFNLDEYFFKSEFV